MLNLPPIFLYPLLIPYIIFLCLKHRCSLSIITKANPAFEMGGLPFTPKDNILKQFKNNNKIIPYKVIRHVANNQQGSFVTESLKKKNKSIAVQFAKQVGFPLVLKPNISHRGIDVKLLHHENELCAALEKQKWDYMLQEYDSAPYEFGVFYKRMPNDSNGMIVSLTEKTIPQVVGDGDSTLHQLIEKSNLIKKKMLLDKNKAEAKCILKAGEKKIISIIAAHNQGSIFYDRRNWLTNHLCDAVEKFCHIEGFYFGRLDVKAQSIDDLKNGKFRVIEVNGVTSEFIHIWDPIYTFTQGMRELLKQWGLVFAISAINRTNEKLEAKRLKQKPAKNLSMIQFIAQYVHFFMLTKKITGKYW